MKPLQTAWVDRGLVSAPAASASFSLYVRLVHQPGKDAVSIKKLHMSKVPGAKEAPSEHHCFSYMSFLEPHTTPSPRLSFPHSLSDPRAAAGQGSPPTGTLNL